MNKPTSFVTTVDLKIAPKLLEGLKQQEFEISHPPYTLFSGKKSGVSCTLYQSGKLMIQGKEMFSFIEFFIEPEILGEFNYSYKETTLDLKGRIGIDESGKGDFFGPLCIAGVFAEGDLVRDLVAMGVKDSKSLNNLKIRKIARDIKKNMQHHIVKINPLKYNELYTQFGNLNSLLAWGHATAIENLAAQTHCEQIIIDQFANEYVVINALKRKKLKIHLTQRHRAEEDVVVAAASILARDTFLEGMEMLGEQLGLILPKGASKLTISAGCKLYERLGLEGLKIAGKLHFKTLDAILGKTTK